MLPSIIIVSFELPSLAAISDIFFTTWSPARAILMRKPAGVPFYRRRTEAGVTL